MKTCSRCKQTLPEEAFHVIKHWYSGRPTLRSHCKPCEVARVGAWQKQNPQKHRQASARWRATNPASHAEVQRGRQARRRLQECSCCSSKERKAFYKSRPDGMQVDHIIPLARGGLHCVRNFQYLSPSANAAKGARLGG